MIWNRNKLKHTHARGRCLDQGSLGCLEVRDVRIQATLSEGSRPRHSRLHSETSRFASYPLYIKSTRIYRLLQNDNHDSFQRCLLTHIILGFSEHIYVESHDSRFLYSQFGVPNYWSRTDTSLRVKTFTIGSTNFRNNTSKNLVVVASSILYDFWWQA